MRNQGKGIDMRKKMISLALVLVLMMNPVSVVAKDNELSKNQIAIADKVAEIATENWGKYGVLPSVAVSQTFVESSLGDNQVRPNNLWGLRPGGEYSSYGSVENGIYAYLRVLNNGRYDKGLHKKDYEIQLQKILDGGYYGEDDGGTVEEYYQNCIKSIHKYRFDKYDKILFRSLQKKADAKRKKKWDRSYTLVYDPSVPNHAVMVDKSIIKRGTVQIWADLEMKGIYDVIPGKKGRKIGISNPYMDGMKVKIIVCEEARG